MIWKFPLSKCFSFVYFSVWHLRRSCQHTPLTHWDKYRFSRIFVSMILCSIRCAIGQIHNDRRVVCYLENASPSHYHHYGQYMIDGEYIWRYTWRCQYVLVGFILSRMRPTNNTLWLSLSWWYHNYRHHQSSSSITTTTPPPSSPWPPSSLSRILIKLTYAKNYSNRFLVLYGVAVTHIKQFDNNLFLVRLMVVEWSHGLD